MKGYLPGTQLPENGEKNWRFGLVVMRVNSCYKGREFESPHRIPTGWTFFQISFCCKVCNVCLKKTKINEKEAVVGPCFEKRRKEQEQQFLSHFWADVDIHVHSTLVIMNDSLSLSHKHTHPPSHTHMKPF